ncbi:MAG TPA: SDR family oxidoreductase [Acidimicrobiales bacterium]|nr:SDR family oxidoreductase [Acidimicrobiales bacterium]
MAVALITGASRGLGRALSEELADRGWSLVIDARDPEALEAVAAALRRRLDEGASVRALAGDVASERHRCELAEAVGELGRLDLLVNNASTLGHSPLLRLEHFDLGDLRRVYEVNVLAPLALVQALLELLQATAGATVVNVSSDAALEHYDSWGAYGSSKAALDHLTATLAAELPSVRFLAVDPGDMRTVMHQEAFFGEDISDRPLPETVVPALVTIIEGDFASGRYRAAEIAGAR